MSLESYREWQEIWDKAEATDAQTYRTHLAAFIETFVQKDKRDRYRYYWLEKQKPQKRHNLRLDRDLDYSLCVQLKGPEEIPTAYQKKAGVFYDLYGEAEILSVETAWHIGMLGSDAVYSLVAGKVAVFFYHEYERWLCLK